MDVAESFDAVIVGSGFGGSVMAYRLAEAGMKVLVLERGKEYPPGSFARNPGQMARNTWDPSAGRHGLLNVWTFDGIDAVVSAGLGGGSLIYANVLLRKNPRWFIKEDLASGGYESWPIGRADLEEHYDRVESMLGAQRFPFDHPDYKDLPKARALRAAGERLGYKAIDLNLAVAFANPDRPPQTGEPLRDREHHNRYGVARQTCRLCSECVIGCNYGAKQTLDLTYLSCAEKTGNCQIRTRREVRSLRRAGTSRWAVRYVDHSEAREGQPVVTDALPQKEVTCRYAIMAAGAFGTTYLLLRSRDESPESFRELSPRLGSAFSGNGDVLTFVLGDSESDVLDPTLGPTITCALEIPDELDGDGAHGRGFYVEDAGYPDFVAWLVEMIPGSIPRALKLALRYLKGRLALTSDTDLGDEIGEAIGDAALSYRSMPLLSMGRDVPDGTMTLEDSRLQLDWNLERSTGYLDRVLQVSGEIAEALERRVAENPLHFLRRLITVHPLGGCPMGANRSAGVVDGHGEAWGAEGLYVVDGAAMPGPTGANPALTIAAFADRCADRLIDRWSRERGA